MRVTNNFIRTGKPFAVNAHTKVAILTKCKMKAHERLRLWDCSKLARSVVLAQCVTAKRSAPDRHFFASANT